MVLLTMTTTITIIMNVGDKKLLHDYFHYRCSAVHYHLLFAWHWWHYCVLTILVNMLASLITYRYTCFVSVRLYIVEAQKLETL